MSYKLNSFTVEKPVSTSLNQFLASLEINNYQLNRGPDRGFGPNQFNNFLVLIR